MNIVRMVLTLASVYSWPLKQINVHNAFLQGDLDEDVYMHVLESFDSNKVVLVCRLRKSLYGLKQASRQWNMKLCDVLPRVDYCRHLILAQGSNIVRDESNRKNRP